MANNNDKPACWVWRRGYCQFFSRRSLFKGTTTWIWSQSFSGFQWLPLGTWAEACNGVGRSRRFTNQGCLNERRGVHRSWGLSLAAQRFIGGNGFQVYPIRISWCNNQISKSNIGMGRENESCLHLGWEIFGRFSEVKLKELTSIKDSHSTWANSRNCWECRDASSSHVIHKRIKTLRFWK